MTQRQLIGLLLLVSFTFLLGCAKTQDQLNIKTPDPQLTSNVIYGSDGRQDLFEVTADWQNRAQSTVALIRDSSLSRQGDRVVIQGENYGTSQMLCSSERFFEQNTAAFCSGALVAADIILTAGHCIETIADCSSTSFVFGFALQSAGVLPQSVSSAEVYRCKEIIKQTRVNSGADFAVIRLDRKVSQHTPLPLRQNGEISVGAPLVVIGHPVGLPTKITSGGQVRSTASSDYFVASVDTYGGNSGSAVFNAETGEIEGILVRGEQDFTLKGSCYVSKVCSENSCRGEDVTRISAARSFIPTSDSGGINPPPPPPPPPGSGQETKQELFSSNVVLNIPDNLSSGVSQNLQVSSVPGKRKVVVNINISHPFIGDLVIRLTSPSGKIVTLQNRSGGRTRDLNKTIDVTAAFSGESQSGLYKLFIADVARSDVGRLTSWSIQFTP